MLHFVQHDKIDGKIPPVGAGDDCFVMPDPIGHLNLKFVLHVADDLAVEEVDDALGAGCVFL